MGRANWAAPSLAAPSLAAPLAAPLWPRLLGRASLAAPFWPRLLGPRLLLAAPSWPRPSGRAAFSCRAFCGRACGPRLKRPRPSTPPSGPRHSAALLCCASCALCSVPCAALACGAFVRAGRACCVCVRARVSLCLPNGVYGASVMAVPLVPRLFLPRCADLLKVCIGVGCPVARLSSPSSASRRRRLLRCSKVAAPHGLVFVAAPFGRAARASPASGGCAPGRWCASSAPPLAAPPLAAPFWPRRGLRRPRTADLLEGCVLRPLAVLDAN
jgi:hypothetical protein